MPQSKFGRYEIMEKLGEGGMGEVYRAHDPQLGREVALKVALKSEEKAQKRFEREARVMAKLSHPNIVNILDIGMEGDRSFFTMELVHGRDLEDVLKDGISLRKFLEILIKVGRAVHYAHKEGVVHRDLKPANIMLDRDGEPKVMDFGLAKEVAREEKISQSLDVIGTPAYMSPEQASGKVRGLDGRIDVYALGAILYRMLTGKPPFMWFKGMNLLYLVACKDPIRPSQFAPHISREIEAVCMKALEKDRDRRYQSTLEFAEDLERYLEGISVQAKPVTHFGQACKWARRNRAIFGVILAAGILILAILAWSLEYHKEAVRSNMGKEAMSAYLQGITRKNKGDMDGAILDFNRAIEIDPRYSEAYYNRGAVRVEKGDMDGAILDFNRAIEHNPRYGQAYADRALLRIEKKDLEGALEDCTQAITLCPDYANAYNNRGKARHFKGDREGAIDDYTRATQLDPRCFQAYYNRGYARREKGDVDGALEDYTQAIKIRPSYGQTYVHRGNIYRDKKNFDDAIVDYAYAIKLQPDLAAGHKHLAITLVKKGWHKQATLGFRRYLDLCPNAPDAHEIREYIKKYDR